MAINRDKILKAAEKLVQKGKIEQAIREYEKLLKLNANDVNTINRVGDLYNRIGQIDKAVEHYEKIARAYAADGFRSKAIAIYKKINRLAPDRADIFERLAELYIQQGLMFEAKSHLQTLADWYLKNDDIAGGIKINRKLIEIDPDNHIAHLRLADLLLRKGQGEEGVEAYDRLGTMLLKAGKIEEAERLYRHALDQKPPTGEFIAPMCEALIDSGNIATAREFYEKAGEISPISSRLKVIGLRLAMATGESARALEMSRELLEKQGEDPHVALLAGKALLAGGEGAEGRDILLPVAEKALEEKKLGVARDIFSHLIKILPQDPQVLNLGLKVLSPENDGEIIFAVKAALAERHYRNGEHQKAFEYYRELNAIEPENEFIAGRKATLEEICTPGMTGESAGIPQGWPDATGKDISDEPSGVIDLIDFEAEPEILEFDIPEADLDISDSDEAPTTEEAAPAPEKKEFDPAERMTEASVFAKYGLFEKAIDYLEQVVEAYPEEQSARERLVLLAIEADLMDRALEHGKHLEALYLKEGKTGALDTLYNSLPSLKEHSDDTSFAATTSDEIEIEIIDGMETGAEEIPTGLEFTPPGIEDESTGITEIEMEDVEFEAVDLESLKPSDGLDFEVLDSSDFTGDPEKEALIQAHPTLAKEPSEPSRPTVSARAATPDIHTSLEQTSTPVEQAAPVDQPLPVEETIPKKKPISPVPAAEIEIDIPPAEPVTRRKPATPAGGLDILGELAELEQSLKAPRLQTPKKAAVTTVEPPLTAPEPAVFTGEPAVTTPEPAVATDHQPEAEATPSLSQDALQEEIPDGIETPGEELPEDLAQLKSYLDHSFYEDATQMLGRLESKYPDNPEVAEARRLLKAKGYLLEDIPQVAEDTEDLFGNEADDYVDLAAELEEEMAAEEAMVSEAAGNRETEADLEDVFREFQKGVAEQLSEEDADTHFNLGIAYKEMGLLPEAIREFQIASRSEDFFVEGCSMIGICYAEQGMWEQSATWYSKALGAEGLNRRAILGLKYDLANALEAAGDQGGAIEIFQEIYADDAGFRDVIGRLGQLDGRARAN